MYSATIIGASGYSGQETLDRILRHPELELGALGSDTYAGQPASNLDPRLARAAKPVPPFVTNADALASAADITFLCQGHETAAAFDPPSTSSGTASLTRALMSSPPGRMQCRS